MGANTFRVAMAGIVMLLSCHDVVAADPPRAVAPSVVAPAPAQASASAASAAASSRGGSPRPYQAPIQVPSAAGQIRSQTLPAPAPAIGVTPTAPPTFTGNCDSSGCWSSDGTRTNAIGGALVRPDGRMCQSVGGVMQCP